jgi:hypothetical protein
MSKLLVMSVMFAMVAIPSLAARDPNPVRALKRALFFTSVANVVYFFALRYVLPRL